MNIQTEKWTDIEDLVARWVARNQDEAEYTFKYIAAVKQGLIDSTYGSQVKQKGGVIQSSGQRFGIAIPPGLMLYIQRFYPDFMDTKEDMRTFHRKFPAFRIAEKM